MSTSGITREEWLAAISQAEAAQVTSDPSLLSLYQYADLMGIHFNSARRQLRKLERAGLAEKREKRMRCEDGKVRAVSAWRLLKKAGKSR